MPVVSPEPPRQMVQRGPRAATSHSSHYIKGSPNTRRGLHGPRQRDAGSHGIEGEPVEAVESLTGDAVTTVPVAVGDAVAQ
ncbi:hypothetical protein ACFY3E_20655 [Streptomyces griseorubiginosus]|uniref:Uncharacterized protein n=1 Tax=Streptomyces griseorubiginosus TaxID=67304 RepID=A0AAI8LA45_9ACTN|nr:hypothetical protein DWG14_08374 [Streptomyces griseorubiginosus]